jgi:hypothetical protein
MFSRARLSREYFYVANDSQVNVPMVLVLTRKYAEKERAGSSPALDF